MIAEPDPRRSNTIPPMNTSIDYSTFHAGDVVLGLGRIHISLRDEPFVQKLLLVVI